MIDELVLINESYDALVKEYHKIKDQISGKKINLLKSMAFHMRSWLVDYHKIIFPIQNINLTKGSETDSPKLISKDIFGED